MCAPFSAHYGIQETNIACHPSKVLEYPARYQHNHKSVRPRFENRRANVWIEFAVPRDRAIVIKGKHSKFHE